MEPRQRENPLPCPLVTDKTRGPRGRQTQKGHCYILQSSWRSKQLTGWGSREEHATFFILVPAIQHLASGLPIRWPKYDQRIQMSLLTGEDPDAGKRLKAKGEKGGRGCDGWIAWPPSGHELERVEDREVWRAAWSSWGHQESDGAERPDTTSTNRKYLVWSAFNKKSSDC